MNTDYSWHSFSIKDNKYIGLINGKNVNMCDIFVELTIENKTIQFNIYRGIDNEISNSIRKDLKLEAPAPIT
jgi:hypothetical protein